MLVSWFVIRASTWIGLWVVECAIFHHIVLECKNKGSDGEVLWVASFATKFQLHCPTLKLLGMSKYNKALERLQAKPKDLTWKELTLALTGLGFVLKYSGGSARCFEHEKTRQKIFVHEPHPSDICKEHLVKKVVKHLQVYGFIEE